MKCLLHLVLCSVSFSLGIKQDLRGFDDSILFSISWPGDIESAENLVDTEDNKPQFQNKDLLKVTTSQKEKYKCLIPELSTDETIKIEDYSGPSPLNLLKPLFSQKICSYRLESYWSYEVCHGRYVRQYHEDREGKLVTTQEYFLGYWSSEKHAKLENEMNAVLDSDDNPKTTKVQGITLPFVEMAMDDGTICDLSGKPRLTRVRYVCYIHGKHEVYSFKETATCEYEIIILSPLLCEHPQFKPKDVSENIISCLPVGDSPVKPRSLLRMESESLKFHQQTVRLINNDKDTKDVLAVLKVEKIDKDGETHLKLELHPLTDEDDDVSNEKPVKPGLLPDKSVPVITDDSPVRAFLNGESCLNGGSGWWKYEFCYGKHVIQYHVDLSGEKTTLLLGKFDEQAHLDWIKENRGSETKLKAGQRTSISHFYSGGDMCDITGKLRQTEVKLKCLENSSSPAQVSLYLLEPRTCHYILGVESPLICDILPLADENGLIKDLKPVLTKQDSVSENIDSENDELGYKDVLKFGND